MELRTMYPPQKDSPTTFLVGAINATDTFAIVGNAGLLPQTLPYPLTIGIDKTLTETVMVTAIDLVTNRLTFTRGENAYPWNAGTNVGRVFNAKDLKDVQDNITDIYNNVSNLQTTTTLLEETVENLEAVVGDNSSGLVKELNDEIVRAKNAEAAEVTRANAAETNLDNIKVNKTSLPQVITDWVYSADGTKVLVTITRYNAVSAETTQYTRNIPVVTDNTMGLMTPEAYNEIMSLRNDVMALQQQGGRFIGLSFNSKAALDAYPIPESVKIGDFTYVLDDETKQDSTTRYVFNGSNFDFTFVINYDPIGFATTTTPGLVKSEGLSKPGKGYIEADGTISILGWDDMNNELFDKVSSKRTINSKALTSDISLTASDVGAVPTNRTINGKALSANIALTASDVGASTLALGITSDTAYRGDRGKTAYEHSQAAHAPVNAQKNSDITKAEIEAKLTGVITTHEHINISGNSATATKLATPRAINGVNFDGTTPITIADTTKAPINHASAGTEYGIGSASYNGHLKLSDAVDTSYSTGNGIASTPKAINTVYNLANTKASMIMSTAAPSGTLAANTLHCVYS